VARILDSNEISGAPVIDGQGRVIGVVSKTDLLHRFLEGPEGSRPVSFLEAVAEGLDRSPTMDPDDLGMVEDFMSPDPLTVTPDAELSDIASMMADNLVHRVIVVNTSQEPVGVVTSLDLLRNFSA
jgi:CBS domain-containing protein